MKNDIVRFKSNYIINKTTFKETSLYLAKRNFLIFACLGILFIPLAIIQEMWWAVCIFALPIIYCATILIVQNARINKEFSNIEEKHKNKQIHSSIKFCNAKVLYTTCYGKKEERQIEYKYSDIKRLWKSKNFFILYVKTDSGRNVIVAKRSDVDEKKFVAFVKQKIKSK